MPNPKPLNPRLAEYVYYINNTGLKPLPIEKFDEDWEPVGPMVRDEMLRHGYIHYGGPGFMTDDAEGIYLRPDLIR